MFETVISGVLVFVIGEAILKFVVEPVNALKKTIAAVAHARIQHGPDIHNPDVVSPERRQQAFALLRSISAQIYSDVRLIPCYGFTRILFGLPNRDQIHKAAKDLTSAANWLDSKNEKKHEYIYLYMQRASDALGLYIAPEDRLDDALLRTIINDRG